MKCPGCSADLLPNATCAQCKRKRLRLGLQIVAGIAFVALVFTVVMVTWGAMKRDGGCQSHCDCSGDNICVNGACTTVYCKTGFFSTRECKDGLRCVKTTHWQSEADRKRYNGVCKPETRDCSRK